MRRDKPVSLLDASSNFLTGSPVTSWPRRESQRVAGDAAEDGMLFTLARPGFVFRAAGPGDLCHLPAITER